MMTDGPTGLAGDTITSYGGNTSAVVTAGEVQNNNNNSDISNVAYHITGINNYTVSGKKEATVF